MTDKAEINQTRLADCSTAGEWSWTDGLLDGWGILGILFDAKRAL